jgi:hypothetical protein
MDEYNDKIVWRWDPVVYSWSKLKAHIKRQVASGEYQVKCHTNAGYEFFECDIDEGKEPKIVDLYLDGTFRVVFL